MGQVRTSLGFFHKNPQLELRKKEEEKNTSHTLLYIPIYFSCSRKHLTSAFQGEKMLEKVLRSPMLKSQGGSQAARVPGGQARHTQHPRTGARPRRVLESSNLTQEGQLRPGQEHPSQPKELIRLWACFSSARRTWNLSAERDMTTG